MAIKPPSLRSLDQALKNTLEKVTHPVKSAANVVEHAAQKVTDVFDVKQPASNVWSALKHPEQGLNPSQLKEFVSGLGDLDLNAARKVLAFLFPPKIRDVQGDQLVKQTEGFRAQLGEVRGLEAKLAALPKDDPRRVGVEQQLRAAEAKLTASTGYTAKTAPKPGALWLDPQFLSDELPNGQVRASQFPTGTPVTRPPDPLDFLFGEDPKREFRLDAGTSARSRSLVPLSGREAYIQQVAANREAAGMPVTDGQPVGVHVSFEGGGGKGKRYAAALSEMYSLGVVPTSLSGSSAGAIAAALTAAGADPAALNAFVTDPVLNKFFDLDLSPDDGGLCDGNVAFDTFDAKLRELTGITDRPVTFADLKVPLKLYATKTSDSAPGKGGEDLTKVENRLFVFSQETTPDTPVALAVRASMAIPGLFDPVQVVDPTTGRRVHLTDGGALDNLPTGNTAGLPEIGLSLLSRDSNHPNASENNAPRGPLTGGNLDSTHIVWNAFNGYALMKEGGGTADDFKNRTEPGKNQFMLSLPVWDLKDPSKANSTLHFGYQEDIDPALDAQTRALTQSFFKNYLDDLRVDGASGTNVTAKLPEHVQFQVPVKIDGKTLTASYAGGDTLSLIDANGKVEKRKVGRQQIEAMYLDHLAFGDLSAQLSYELDGKKGIFDWF